MKKKILIFGGSGYVGSKLIVNLLKNNFEVINYDLDLFGKCFPTSETGTPIAVAPSAVPTNTPKLI